MNQALSRRTMLVTGVACVGAACSTNENVTIAEIGQPEVLRPVAPDGHEGLALFRKPQGPGPFPTVILIHPGLITAPLELLHSILRGSTAMQFVAAGYAVAAITYRSRDEDPLAQTTVDDCVAAFTFLQSRPDVTASRIAVMGCSGGGDLALEVAAATSVCAAVAEEPASMMFTGVFHREFPKAGARFTPMDASVLETNPLSYYTDEHRARTRAKIARIGCPILIQQSDPPHDMDPASRLAWAYNSAVLIPELRAVGARLTVLSYPQQPHCFCFLGNIEQPSGRPNRIVVDAEVLARAWRNAEGFIASA